VPRPRPSHNHSNPRLLRHPNPSTSYSANRAFSHTQTGSPQNDFPQTSIPSHADKGMSSQADPGPCVTQEGNSSPESARSSRRRPRPRKPISCEPCRRSKLRCDRQAPCSSCKRRDCIQRCRYHNIWGDALDQNETVRSSMSRQAGLISPRSSSANFRQNNTSELTVPDDDQENRDFTRASWDAILRRPVDPTDQRNQCQQPISGNLGFPFSLISNTSTDDLRNFLPPADCCDFLIIQHFTHLSSMFHVLHGPSFQSQYNAFAQDPTANDPTWLALLFAILSIGIKTLDYNDPVLAGLKSKMPTARDISAMSCELRGFSMICLGRDNFLFHYRLDTLECLLLLIYSISHDEGVDVAWTLLGKPLQSLLRTTLT
jgi:hypothetical protein